MKNKRRNVLLANLRSRSRRNSFETLHTRHLYVDEMAATIADAQLLNNNTEDGSGVLPCPHFEGVEKRIEIDFHDGRLQRGTLFFLFFLLFTSHPSVVLRLPWVKNPKNNKKPTVFLSHFLKKCLSRRYFIFPPLPPPPPFFY